MADTPGFVALALSRPVVARAFGMSLVVGTLLALINHGEVLLTLAPGGIQTIKIALTYLVPYGVSTYSSVRALQQ